MGDLDHNDKPSASVRLAAWTLIAIYALIIALALTMR